MDRKCLFFSGNHADLGGDVVFGGCLSNCIVLVNNTTTTINKSDAENILWDIVSLGEVTSQSTFVDYPNKVVFCKNTSFTHSDNSYQIAACDNRLKSISVYRGEVFNLPSYYGSRQLLFPFC